MSPPPQRSVIVTRSLVRSTKLGADRRLLASLFAVSTVMAAASATGVDRQEQTFGLFSQWGKTEKGVPIGSQ